MFIEHSVNFALPGNIYGPCNRTHVKAKKTGGSKLRAKFESLRREIKAGVKKQHGLYVNTLFVILRLIPETSTGT